MERALYHCAIRYCAIVNLWIGYRLIRILYDLQTFVSCKKTQIGRFSS